MTQRERESLTDSDPHALLFGDDVDGDAVGEPADRVHPSPRPRPASHHRHAAPVKRTPHRRRLLIILGVLVLVVGLTGALVVPRVLAVFNPPDYSGSGSGRVSVQVAQGDSAGDIGNTLQRAGVVKSAQAFRDAAKDNSAAQNIQPGTYLLHRHMSATSALALLLDPSSRSAASDVIVVEGATSFAVADKLVAALGPQSRTAVRKALADPADLGIPLGYSGTSGPPTSIEGFLYPATYTISPKDAPSVTLQKMTSGFAEHDRSSGFAASAKAVNLTPYQALIIASIAQAEAKYPEDMARVVRVILNRIAAHRPLQIDATTRYGALVDGVKPGTVSYAKYDSPYNSYLHAGLPPTPISNPGAEAMDAAVHPAAGSWMYYVNADAQGHLFFTSSEAAFAAAVAKCKANNWGCG